MRLVRHYGGFPLMEGAAAQIGATRSEPVTVACVVDFGVCATSLHGEPAEPTVDPYQSHRGLWTLGRAETQTELVQKVRTLE